jgi:hypothetical protein
MIKWGRSELARKQTVNLSPLCGCVFESHRPHQVIQTAGVGADD